MYLLQKLNSSFYSFQVPDKNGALKLWKRVTKNRKNDDMTGVKVLFLFHEQNIEEEEIQGIVKASMKVLV